MEDSFYKDPNCLQVTADLIWSNNLKSEKLSVSLSVTFHQIILADAIIIFYYVLCKLMFKYYQEKGGISEWNFIGFVHLQLLNLCDRNDNRMVSTLE